MSSSKLGRLAGRLLAGAGLAAGLAACSTGPTSIGVGLPSVNANTGVYLLDTLTVRATTVLRDSVVTSASTYLLVGRTFDRQLGFLKAVSFYQPQLNGAFVPQANFVLDSVALRLAADNARYRYGDTTQLQSLVRVHAMRRLLPPTGPLFASSKLTPLEDGSYYDKTALLNLMVGGAPAAIRRRASPNIVYIRLRLAKSVGEPLFAAGQAGGLRSQSQLQDLLPGLVIAPNDSDNGALVRLLASSDDAGLILYYHDPTDPTTAQSYTFSQNGGRHVYQVTAERATGGAQAAIGPLPTESLKFTQASENGEQTVVEGAIGLQTRLEFPYLTDIRGLGRSLTITSADVTLQVPPTTLTPYLPDPPALDIKTSNLNRQPTSNYLSGVAFARGTSPVTALEQTTYTFAITSYVQAVLNGSVPNNGLLLSSATPELPNRVILGGPRSRDSKLQLRLYVINNQ